MKNLKMTIAAIALASVSFGSFAAELVNAQPADLQKPASLPSAVLPT